MKRREFLKTACVTTVAVGVTVPNLAWSKEAKPKSKNALSYEAAEQAITGGKSVVDSAKVALTVPEIAENGAVVPVKVSVDHPMEKDNYVKAIHVLTTKNANARCADVMLSPMNGKAYFATRIKLGGTQKVVALVETSDGSFLRSSKLVKVTIGGCG